MIELQIASLIVGAVLGALIFVLLILGFIVWASAADLKERTRDRL